MRSDLAQQELAGPRLPTRRGQNGPADIRYRAEVEALGGLAPVWRSAGTFSGAPDSAVRAVAVARQAGHRL